ncbi:MAG: transcription elongation factor GreA [Pseudomonadota bacterium]
MEAIPLTKEGMGLLSNELDNLKKIERPKVIQEIADARAHGDLRENAEYHAAREKQGMIEARIAELEDKLARATVVDFSGQNADQVRFGAFVTIADVDSDEKRTYRIVGDLESDIAARKVSLSSPVAQALLGRKRDDIVEIQAPKGAKEFVVVEIRY